MLFWPTQQSYHLTLTRLQIVVTCDTCKVWKCHLQTIWITAPKWKWIGYTSHSHLLHYSWSKHWNISTCLTLIWSYCLNLTHLSRRLKLFIIIKNWLHATLYLSMTNRWGSKYCLSAYNSRNWLGWQWMYVKLQKNHLEIFGFMELCAIIRCIYRSIYTIYFAI